MDRALSWIVGVTSVGIIAINAYDLFWNTANSLYLAVAAIVVAVVALVNIVLDDDRTWLLCGAAMLTIALLQYGGMVSQ